MFKTMLIGMFIFSFASLAAIYGSDKTTETDDWEQFYDARLGFTIEHPAGWTVQTQGYSVLVQNADHSSLAMIEAFANKPGETAKTRVNNISALHPALFPAARIERIAQQPSQADQVVGALSYKNSRGQLEQARVLCLVYQGSGMLYALAAPNDRFTNERETLLRILKSIRFGVTPSSPTAAGGRGSAKGGSTAPNKGLRFVRWTDPKEHAYTVEVPQGWTVDGGAYLIEGSEARVMNRIISPEKDMVVQIGNENLPETLLMPTPMMLRTYPGIPEGQPFSPNHMGQMMFLHYMPAPDFNKWYLDKVMKQGIDDLSITRESDLPEVTQNLTKILNNNPTIMAKVSVAQIEFKGRSKQTGKPIIGILISRIIVRATRANPSLANWNAQPSYMICLADDKQEEHQQMLAEILARINQSFKQDPVFVEKFNQQIAANNGVLAQKGAEAIERSKQQSAEIARNAEANRQSIMGSYWAKNGAQGDFNRKFNNYIGDNTDVNDPTTGQSYKVGSGYSNYYLDPRSNTIIGTNSTNRPPVDFTVLTEY